jgi:hypothetical protein
VNKETYIDALHGLRDTVRTKTGQYSSTPVGFGHGSKNKVTILEPTSCSPDLTPVDCYLFPRLESALKRGLFYATDIIKYATEDLKSLS